MQFAPGCLWSPYSRPTFSALSLGPPLAKSQKMADLGVLGKFVITRFYGHFWSRGLQQNVLLWLHFKRIPIRRWCNFAPGCFWSPYSRPTFSALSLGPPLAKSQKMADLGVLGKFVITRFYGHFWSRGLQQNVLLWLHFKRIPIRRWCNLRQGVFEAPIVGLFFSSSFPWSPLGKISENGRFRCPWQICHNSALRALLEPRFAAKCSPMIAL